MGRTIVMLVMLLVGSGAAATVSVGADVRTETTPAYRVDGTITVDWTESAGTVDRGHAVYAISGPLLTNAQRQAYAPIVVPERFSFRPLATAIPSYLRAELQSVSWTRTETIDGCGDGSASATRTSTVENIVDRRAIFEQATTINRLGGTSELNVGAITMYIWQNGAPQHDYSAYSNLGEVFVRSTGGCTEVLNGGPGTAQVPMHDLFSLGMFQLGSRGLRAKGRKTADGAFAFYGTARSADASPSPTSHNTIKVTVDLRVRGASGARPVLVGSLRQRGGGHPPSRRHLRRLRRRSPKPVRARGALLLPLEQPLRALRTSGEPAGPVPLGRLSGPPRGTARGRSTTSSHRVDAGEGLVQRVVEVPLVERLQEPVARQQFVQAVAQLHEYQVDAVLVELAVETLEHVGCSDVDVGDGFALDDDPVRIEPVDQLVDLLAEHARIGEEQGSLPAEHDDAGGLRGVGVCLDGAPGVERGDSAEHLAGGPPVPLEEAQDREPDRDQDHFEYAEQHDAQRGRHRQCECRHADTTELGDRR